MQRKLLVLFPLALVTLLGMAGSAQALTVPGNPALLPLLAAPSDEVEEGEAETSEDEDFEAEECEAEEEGGCEEAIDAEAPPECLPSSAEATVIAFRNRDKVRLQIRYATTSPTAVAIEYGLHGAKGSLFLGSEKRKRFGRKGVLRLSKSLTDAQMAKVMAARDFTVRIRVLDAPDRCQSILDRHLTLRRTTPSGLTWQERE